MLNAKYDINSGGYDTQKVWQRAAKSAESNEEIRIIKNRLNKKPRKKQFITYEEAIHELVMRVTLGIWIRKNII